jgi:heme-degrading monooxygenase HmoA
VIVEHAILQVEPGRAPAFEAAMHSARPLIAASPGFRSIRVLRGAEVPGAYLLLVEWDDIASHRDGFRKSERYQQWRALLHPFYDPLPAVQYFGEDL